MAQSRHHRAHSHPLASQKRAAATPSHAVGSGASLGWRTRLGSQDGRTQSTSDQPTLGAVHPNRALYRDTPQGDPRTPVASEHDWRMGRPRVRSASPAGAGRVRERETATSNPHPTEADHAYAALAPAHSPVRDRAQRRANQIPATIIMGRRSALGRTRRCRDPAHSTAHVRNMDAPCRGPYVAGGRRARCDGRDRPKHLRPPCYRISPGCRRRFLTWQRMAKKPLKKTG